VRSQPATNAIPLMNFNELRSMVHNENEQARMGYVLRTNYGYDDRYLLEFAGRADASWRFPPESRWGFFPSASAGWRISNEGFFQNSRLSNLFSELKLRGSIGALGDENVGIGAFDYLEGYTFRQGSSVFDGVVYTGSEPRGLPVRNITWIKSTMTNLGLDFGLMGNSLNGTLEGFYRKRTGLPAQRYDVLIPQEVAIDLPNENLNADAHMGVEGSLNFSSSIGRDFRYSVGTNATFSRQRDLYTYKPRFANSWHEYRSSIADRWAFINWGYQVVGQFRSEEQIANHTVDNDGRNNTTMLPGDLIYKDVNGDGIINGLDERPIGFRQGALPYLSFGLSGSASFRNFDFSMAWSGAGFQSYERTSEMKVPFWNNANSPAFVFEDRWRREDPFDLNSPWIPGKYPLARRNVTDHSNLRKSDFWVTNVNYFRLETVELGYTLPQSILERVRLRNGRVFVNGYNVFSIDNTGEFGIDPELASGNGLQYPQMRAINVGASLGL
jgi:TonB-linked SusC/RagA family outer membrane protein